MKKPSTFRKKKFVVKTFLNVNEVKLLESISSMLEHRQRGFFEKKLFASGEHLEKYWTWCVKDLLKASEVSRFQSDYISATVCRKKFNAETVLSILKIWVSSVKLFENSCFMY